MRWLSRWRPASLHCTCRLASNSRPPYHCPASRRPAPAASATAAQERLAQALFDEATPATDIVTLLEEETLRVQVDLHNSTAGRLQWASALLPQALADAEARYLQREATGSAVLGVPTGLAQLDNLVGGLNEGLYLLAGPPGMGKTTLGLQMAAAATTDVPVVVVTLSTPREPDPEAVVRARRCQPPRCPAWLCRPGEAPACGRGLGTRGAASGRGGRQQPAHGGPGPCAGPARYAAAPDGALPGRGRLSAVVGEGRRGPPRNFSVRERVDMLGACSVSSRWACTARCWRSPRRTAARAAQRARQCSPRFAERKR